MANVLAGFRPVKHMTGAPYNGQMNRYVIPASDSAAVNVGDLVKLAGGVAINGYPACTRSTSGTTGPILGSVVGIEIDPSNLNLPNIRQASTLRYVWVADSPDLIFAAPQDGSGGVISAANVGKNVSVVLGSAQAVAPGASAMKVASNSVATTSTLPLQVVGISDAPDNDPTSTARPAEVLVRVNVHQYGPFISGV